MRPWQVTLEGIMMLVLWVANAGSDTLTCGFLILTHNHGGWVMLGVLGVTHFLLNCWVLRFRWRKMNKLALLVQFLTQTAAFYMICRRAWQSLVPYCTKDDRTKKRKVLIAKYSLCIETWNSSKKFPIEGTTMELRSCVPPEIIGNSNHIATIPDSCPDVENNDSMIDQFFTNEEESQQIIPVGTTKYTEGTYDIELNFSAPQEVYAGVSYLQMILLISPVISVITWLLTQKGVSEPWRNVGLMIPLQMNLSVTRALLVIGMGSNSLTLAAACYLSVKAVGIITLIAYLIYAKKIKNVELYGDEIERYNYKPIYDPVIQFSESCVYMSWAIWLYATTPRIHSSLSYYHLPLMLFLSTLLGHVFGLTWLWFTKSKVKKPLKDPKCVLRLVQSLEYIRT
ncbi:uncharacterized protein [Macrobrachium rosenbergii]